MEIDSFWRITHTKTNDTENRNLNILAILTSRGGSVVLKFEQNVASINTSNFSIFFLNFKNSNLTI